MRVFKLMALTLVFVISSLASAQTTKPNILFILTDDQGYGDLSSYGSKTISTPNIDTLAEDGMKFNNFYVHHRCSPTRMSFMIGSYAHRTSLPRVIYSWDRMGINKDEITTAEVMRDAGYSTGIVGKWHLGEAEEFNPVNHGFEFFYGFLSYGRGKTAIYRNKEIAETIKKKTHGKHSPKLLDEAIGFIEDNKKKDKPFFLFYSSPLPHSPFLPSKRFAGKSKHGAYGDQVQDIDWQVGELLKTLDKNGLADNTLVIFTSDNGPELGIPDHGTSGILRDGKWSSFEGGIRVPMLARWPAQIPKGSISDELVGIFDMLPTFSAIGGGQVPQGREIDGKSILPYLQGKKLGQPIHDAVFVPGSVVRSNDWKLTAQDLTPGGPPNNWGERKGAAKGTLFNLKNDPSETTDVAAQNPEKVKELKNKMAVLLHNIHQKEGIREVGKTAYYTKEVYDLEWQYERTPHKQKEKRAELRKKIDELTKCKDDPSVPVRFDCIKVEYSADKYVSIQGRDYELAFSDEFNGNSVNTKLWDYRTDSKHWSTQKADNVEVKDGLLHLNVKKEKANGKDYTGAGLISKSKYQYGYYEAKLMIPAGGGWHTSFWLMTHDGSGGTNPKAATIEIDILENDSKDRGGYHANLHKWYDGHKDYEGMHVSTPTIGTEFQVLACEYTPTSVRYYANGKLVRVVDIKNLDHSPLNIWLTSIASFLGDTKRVDDSKLPSSAVFDYVRFYKPTK